MHCFLSLPHKPSDVLGFGNTCIRLKYLRHKHWFWKWRQIGRLVDILLDYLYKNLVLIFKNVAALANHITFQCSFNYIKHISNVHSKVFELIQILVVNLCLQVQNSNMKIKQKLKQKKTSLKYESKQSQVSNGFVNKEQILIRTALLLILLLFFMNIIL